MTDDGFFSVVCRATEGLALDEEDTWACGSMATSWEFVAHCDRMMMDSQPASGIAYKIPLRADSVLPDGLSIDLSKATNFGPQITSIKDLRDSHVLQLGDPS